MLGIFISHAWLHDVLTLIRCMLSFFVLVQDGVGRIDRYAAMHANTSVHNYHFGLIRFIHCRCRVVIFLIGLDLKSALEKNLSCTIAVY